MAITIFDVSGECLPSTYIGKIEHLKTHAKVSSGNKIISSMAENNNIYRSAGAQACPDIHDPAIHEIMKNGSDRTKSECKHSVKNMSEENIKVGGHEKNCDNARPVQKHLDVNVKEDQCIDQGGDATTEHKILQNNVQLAEKKSPEKPTLQFGHKNDPTCQDSKGDTETDINMMHRLQDQNCGNDEKKEVIPLKPVASKDGNLVAGEKKESTILIDHGNREVGKQKKKKVKLVTDVEDDIKERDQTEAAYNIDTMSKSDRESSEEESEVAGAEQQEKAFWKRQHQTGRTRKVSFRSDDEEMPDSNSVGVNSTVDKDCTSSKEIRSAEDLNVETTSTHANAAQRDIVGLGHEEFSSSGISSGTVEASTSEEISSNYNQITQRSGISQQTKLPILPEESHNVSSVQVQRNNSARVTQAESRASQETPPGTALREVTHHRCGTPGGTTSLSTKTSTRFTTGTKTNRSLRHPHKKQCKIEPFPDESETFPFKNFDGSVICAEKKEDLQGFLKHHKGTSKTTGGISFCQHLKVKEVERKKEVGCGSYGKVWLSEAPGNIRLALKQIHRKTFRGNEAMALFENPGNVFPKLFAVLFSEEVVYLLMEYLPSTLRQRIQNGERFKKDEVRRLLFKLVCILCELKAGGLCHGDIKAENIGFTKEGDVKLLDLGTVWEFGHYFESDPGGFTPEFMSPQMCNPNKHNDESCMNDCDIYSTALTVIYVVTNKNQRCLFHEMKHTHTHKEMKDYIACKKCHTHLLRLIADAGLGEGVCNDMVWMLQQMLAYDPAHRISPRSCWAHRLFSDLRDEMDKQSKEERWQRTSHCDRPWCLQEKQENAQLKEENALLNQKIEKLEEANLRESKVCEEKQIEDSGFSSNLPGLVSNEQ